MKGVTKWNSFALMNMSRYKSIVHCIGYPTTADELDTSINTTDTWTQKQDTSSNHSQSFEK